MTPRKSQKGPRKNDNDQVELHARTITFEAKASDSLEVMTGDFKAHEIGEGPSLSDLGDPEVIVEIDAWMSAGEAIQALKVVIAHIEVHGLPETKQIVPRRTGRAIEASQDAIEGFAEFMGTLPADLQDLVAKSIRTRNGEGGGHE